MQEYFHKKELITVLVLRNSTLSPSTSLWKAPLSWSAWQWEIIIF